MSIAESISLMLWLATVGSVAGVIVGYRLGRREAEQERGGRDAR